MIRVAVESGTRRTFAIALDWPGWARSAKTETEAAAELMRYRQRYSAALGVEVPDGRIEVAERLTGNATTDFGAPGAIPAADRRPVADLDHLVHLWRAARDRFEQVASSAPEELRKGPRGGGRNTSKIREHVEMAERGYLPKIGIRAGGVETARLLEAGIDRSRVVVTSGEETAWPIRYFVRRSMWHLLDHVWEIEDRS